MKAVSILTFTAPDMVDVLDHVLHGDLLGLTVVTDVTDDVIINYDHID